MSGQSAPGYVEARTALAAVLEKECALKTVAYLPASVRSNQIEQFSLTDIRIPEVHRVLPRVRCRLTVTASLGAASTVVTPALNCAHQTASDTVGVAQHCSKVEAPGVETQEADPRNPRRDATLAGWEVRDGWRRGDRGGDAR